MPDRTTASSPLDGSRIPVQAKLAAAWTSFMFLYVYVDYLHLYKPGVVSDILAGVVFTFEISAGFAVTALALTIVPVIMIWLSVILQPRYNRATNLVVATLLIPYMVFNAAGAGSWLAFYALGIAVELLLLAFILQTSWAWPRRAAVRPAGLPGEAVTDAHIESVTP